MADHILTFTNNIRVFGLGPVSRWGAFEWASSPADINITTNVMWGSNRILFSIEKITSDTVSFNTSAYNYDVHKLLSDTVNISSERFYIFEKIFGITLNSSTDVTNMYKVDGDGYFYEFVGNTTNGNDQVISDYTKLSDLNTSYTAYTTSTVSWSTL